MNRGSGLLPTGDMWLTGSGNWAWVSGLHIGGVWWWLDGLRFVHVGLQFSLFSPRHFLMTGFRIKQRSQTVIDKYSDGLCM